MAPAPVEATLPITLFPSPPQSSQTKIQELQRKYLPQVRADPSEKIL